MKNNSKSRQSKKTVSNESAIPSPPTNREETQEEKRRRARDIVITQFIFVLIPFIFLFIISIENSFAGIIKAMADLVLGPQLALVSSLLYGQTCVKLISGLAKRGIPKWYKGTKRAAFFLALTMICAFLYARISSSNIASVPYAVVQVVLFIHSIESFIVYGSVGQRLMEMPEKAETN